MTDSTTQPALGTRIAVHRHGVLFYSLLLTLFVTPVVAMFEIRNVVLQAVLAMNVVAGVLGLPPGRRRGVLLALTLGLVGVSLVPSSILDVRWSNLAFAFWGIVGLLAAAESVRFVMRARTIDAEHVYAALSVYLLGGMFFAIAHWSIEQAWPGSYIEASHPGTPFRLPDAIYYSFVTIASLGYGDIVPASDVARGCAVLEAVGGQLYLAVLIARLVGAWMKSPDSKDR